MDNKMKFKDVLNPPPKKPKYSPTRNDAIVMPDSSSNKTIPPRPQNPSMAVKLSPTIVHGQCCSKNKRKRGSTPPPLKKSSSSTMIRPAVTYCGLVRKSSPWVKTRLLGKWGYGSVFLATNNNEVRAIKSADISRASSLMDEGMILRRLQSPFVIGCYGDEIVPEGTDHHFNLIPEYCSGQSLGDLIKNKHEGLMEIDVKQFARDVLFRLKYIHDMNIIHCDIKPDNLLFSPADHRVRLNGYLTKIADFGLALEKGSVEYKDALGHTRGTRRYMAPELISCGIVDFSVDIWSFGCTVLELLTGKQVWGEFGNLAYENLVKIVFHTNLIPHIPTGLSSKAQDFLRRCLVKDPASRWGIDALMNHPFLSLDEI